MMTLIRFDPVYLQCFLQLMPAFAALVDLEVQILVAVALFVAVVVTWGPTMMLLMHPWLSLTRN